MLAKSKADLRKKVVESNRIEKYQKTLISTAKQLGKRSSWKGNILYELDVVYDYSEYRGQRI